MKFPLKTRIKTTLAVFLIVLLSSLLFFYIKRTDNDKKENAIAGKIESIYIITPVFENSIGKVVSQNSIELSFRTEGKITYCPYTEGDWVKKGMLLAQNDGNLNDFKLKEEIEKLEELKIKSARIDKYYKRMNILHNSGAISDNDWEEAFYESKTAKKEISIQDKIVRQAREKLAYTKIISPYDGYISKKVLDKNEFAPIGETVLVLNYSKYTQIETMVDFSLQALIKINSKVKITKNNKTYYGFIKQISSTSLNRGGYLVKIHLDGNYPELKEGENTNVEFLNIKTPGVLIPLKFVKKEKNENFAFKLNKNKIQKTKIQTGKIREIKEKFFIEVLDNLKIGDEIIEFKK